MDEGLGFRLQGPRCGVNMLFGPRAMPNGLTCTRPKPTILSLVSGLDVVQSAADVFSSYVPMARASVCPTEITRLLAVATTSRSASKPKKIQTKSTRCSATHVANDFSQEALWCCNADGAALGYRLQTRDTRQ